MNRKEIIARFYQLNDFLFSKKVYVELSVYGGAAMALYYDFRRSTEDIDCVIKSSEENIKACLAEFNRAHHLAYGWVNEAVKVFIPSISVTDVFLDLSSLKVSVCSPQVLLAMKCRAGRLEDINDIRELVKLMDIHSIDEIIANNDTFFPNRPLSDECICIIAPMIS